MLITSTHNPIVKTAHALLNDYKKRKKLSQTVIEGTHLIEAYFKANQTPSAIIVSESGLDNAEIANLINHIESTSLSAKKLIHIVSDNLYKHISSLGTSLPIMAIIPIPTLTINQPIHSDCLIVNGVQDTGNLGTLLRTAAATGFKTVLITQGSANAFSPKVLRAGMGANFSLSIYENIRLDDILAFVKVPLFATSSHSDKVIYQTDLTRPLALIVGHEGQGVCPTLMAKAHPLTLPQLGEESLNVAVAGSVCLCEILRQRRYA